MKPLTYKTHLPKFSQIQPEQVESNLQQLLNRNRNRLAELLAQAGPFHWDNLLRPLEEMEDELHRYWSPIKHLTSVANTDTWRVVYKACLPLLSDYHMEIHQNVALYEAIQAIADSPDYNSLDHAQKAVITHTLRDFRLSGVHLPPADKRRFAELDKELSQLTTQFEENLLDATQNWSRLIDDESALAGLPEHAKAAAKQAAEEKNLQGWLFTLEMPSYLAVMTYADNAALREEMYYAFVTRASDQGPAAGKWDNSQVMQDILKIRLEMAKLLDFANYAEYSLATKMAKTTDEVMQFLSELAQASLDKARQEFIQLRCFAEEHFGKSELQAWDIAYYSEKLRQQEYAVAKEDFRPYFPEHKVLSGLFAVVERLYGMQVTPVPQADVWRPEVRLFAIHDASGQLRGHFYIDLYARAGKRDGAWMDDCAVRRKSDGEIQTPVAFVTCNFHAPVGNDPALFTHEEVTTLFHEFGHATQHLFSTVDYADVSGINGVPWDAVELASQFMESWCWEQPGVDLIAEHYQTKQALPAELFQKLIRAKNFQSAMHMVRQLQFSLFDFRLHQEFDPSQPQQIAHILAEVREQLAVFPVPAYNRFQHSFGHIFSGGYAAGYYSYKWAEVLAADAFSKFEENGIFDRKTGEEFLHTILESGGAVEPMDLFIQFRGRPPEIDALLRQNGIT